MCTSADQPSYPMRCPASRSWSKEHYLKKVCTVHSEFGLNPRLLSSATRGRRAAGGGDPSTLRGRRSNNTSAGNTTERHTTHDHTTNTTTDDARQQKISRRPARGVVGQTPQMRGVVAPNRTRECSCTPNLDRDGGGVRRPHSGALRSQAKQAALCVVSNPVGGLL